MSKCVHVTYILITILGAVLSTIGADSTGEMRAIAPALKKLWGDATGTTQEFCYTNF